MKEKNIPISFWILSMAFISSSFAFSQVPAFDRLEQLFFQKHYKIVYRKSNRLINNPNYDYSQIPRYYRSISALEMASNTQWYKRNEEVFEKGIIDLLDIKSSNQGQRIFEAHIYELSVLKIDLDSWLSDIKRQGALEKHEKYSELISKIFSGLNLNDVYEISSKEIVMLSNSALSSRFEMVKFAKMHLNVPYVSAGDTPVGFDCSGFTCFIFENYGKKIPRRAKDQFEASNKLKANDAKMGDLVFFSNGGEISHVGLLINEPGKAKTMIHASTSKGISIVEIDSSEYWTKRLVGFGSFLQH